VISQAAQEIHREVMTTISGFHRRFEQKTRVGDDGFGEPIFTEPVAIGGQSKALIRLSRL
jgi:hypothetical protein